MRCSLWLRYGAMATERDNATFDALHPHGTLTWHFDTSGFSRAGQSMDAVLSPEAVAGAFKLPKADLLNPETVQFTTSGNARPFAISLFATDKTSAETGAIIPTGIKLDHTEAAHSVGVMDAVAAHHTNLIGQPHTSPVYGVIPTHGHMTPGALVEANRIATERLKAQTHPRWEKYSVDNIGTGSSIAATSKIEGGVWNVTPGPSEQPDLVYQIIKQNLVDNPNYLGSEGRVIDDGGIPRYHVSTKMYDTLAADLTKAYTPVTDIGAHGIGCKITALSDLPSKKAVGDMFTVKAKITRTSPWDAAGFHHRTVPGTLPVVAVHPKAANIAAVEPDTIRDPDEATAAKLGFPGIKPADITVTSYKDYVSSSGEAISNVAPLDSAASVFFKPEIVGEEDLAEPESL